MFLQRQPVSELTVSVASGAAIVTAIAALVTAIIARNDNGRHWRSMDSAIRREGEFAKERKVSTKALLAAMETAVKREAELARERDAATKALLASEISHVASDISHVSTEVSRLSSQVLSVSSELSRVSKQVEDLARSTSDRFDAQSRMIEIRLDALNSTIRTNSAAQEAA